MLSNASRFAIIKTRRWQSQAFDKSIWTVPTFIEHTTISDLSSSFYQAYSNRKSACSIPRACWNPQSNFFACNFLKNFSYDREYPTNIYLFKINNRYNRKRCEICSKLTVKTPERRLWLLCHFNSEDHENCMENLLYQRNLEMENFLYQHNLENTVLLKKVFASKILQNLPPLIHF